MVCCYLWFCFLPAYYPVSYVIIVEFSLPRNLCLCYIIHHLLYYPNIYILFMFILCLYFPPTFSSCSYESCLLSGFLRYIPSNPVHPAANDRTAYTLLASSVATRTNSKYSPICTVNRAYLHYWPAQPHCDRENTFLVSAGIGWHSCNAGHQCDLHSIPLISFKYTFNIIAVIVSGVCFGVPC